MLAAFGDDIKGDVVATQDIKRNVVATRGRALLVAERLLNENKIDPVASLMQSLSMLVCTEGKERTLSEYTALLQDAGFAEVRGRNTGAPLDAVLAVKG